MITTQQEITNQYFEELGKLHSVSDTCGVLEDEAWIVTDEFMLQIPVCSTSEKPVSLSNRGAVNIGDEFSIYVLPIKGLP